MSIGECDNRGVPKRLDDARDAWVTFQRRALTSERHDGQQADKVATAQLHGPYTVSVGFRALEGKRKRLWMSGSVLPLQRADEFVILQTKFDRHILGSRPIAPRHPEV